jgi:hypothetical protein
LNLLTASTNSENIALSRFYGGLCHAQIYEYPQFNMGNGKLFDVFGTFLTIEEIRVHHAAG